MPRTTSDDTDRRSFERLSRIPRRTAHETRELERLRVRLMPDDANGWWSPTAEPPRNIDSPWWMYDHPTIRNIEPLRFPSGRVMILDDVQQRIHDHQYDTYREIFERYQQEWTTRSVEPMAPEPRITNREATRRIYQSFTGIPDTAKVEEMAEDKGPYDYYQGSFDPSYIGIYDPETGRVNYWTTDGAVRPVQMRFMLLRYYSTRARLELIYNATNRQGRPCLKPNTATGWKDSSALDFQAWSEGTRNMNNVVVTWYEDKWWRRTAVGVGGLFIKSWQPITEEDDVE